MATPYPSAIDAPPTERQSTYRDAQLHALMKALRAAVKSNPYARIALEKAEGRLRYVLRVVEVWDKSHAEHAELLIRLGNLAAANSAATMIFDGELRQSLLRQCFVGGDDGAADRVAENAARGLEVL